MDPARAVSVICTLRYVSGQWSVTTKEHLIDGILKL